MSLRAMQNCIIIERDVEKHELFELPPGEDLETGIAISTGPDCKDIKIGDHLYFGVAQDFTHEGKKYVVMREPHVLGVLNG